VCIAKEESVEPFPISAEKTIEDLTDLAQQLFPIHRTLVNDGYSQSLEIVKTMLNDIDVLKYASGTEVWDWVIPQAWNVKEAYIETLGGEKIVDFKNSNLHLAAYSSAFSGVVTREELLGHLYYREDYPDAIPYTYLYYKKSDTWRFNIARNQLQEFTDLEYRVHIDVSCEPGALEVGELYLPGESKKEIIISTYLCHPSLANDNLSGVLASVALFKGLSKMKNRKYSYRLLIVPETIGAITWLANHEDHFSNIVGVYCVYDCGVGNPIMYKESYFADATVDVIAKSVLKEHESKVYSYYPSGSDERQYNAPGVRIPAGSFMRARPAEFREYHTSKDDLSILSYDALHELVCVIWKCIQVLEHNDTYVNCYKGEPFYSKYPIEYPVFQGEGESLRRNVLKILTHATDGTQSLFVISEKWNVPFDQICAVAKQMEQHGLIKKIS